MKLPSWLRRPAAKGGGECSSIDQLIDDCISANEAVHRVWAGLKGLDVSERAKLGASIQLAEIMVETSSVLRSALLEAARGVDLSFSALGQEDVDKVQAVIDGAASTTLKH